MIAASLVVLALAAALFMGRLLVGPTLADRVNALNGLLIAGSGAIAAHAVSTGRGAFLPILVVIGLVGFVGTAMVARFIESRNRWIGEVLLLLGSLLTLAAAVGMVRFDEVFTRMHALAKASTLAVMLMFLGAAVSLSHPNDITSLVLAAALQVLTSPLASNMISFTTYDTEGCTVPLIDLEDDDGDDGSRDG